MDAIFGDLVSLNDGDIEPKMGIDDSYLSILNMLKEPADWIEPSVDTSNLVILTEEPKSIGVSKFSKDKISKKRSKRKRVLEKSKKKKKGKRKKESDINRLRRLSKFTQYKETIFEIFSKYVGIRISEFILKFKELTGETMSRRTVDRYRVEYRAEYRVEIEKKYKR